MRLSVTFAKLSLAGLLLASACADQLGPTSDSRTGSWSVDYASQDGALLSVWGSSADDVWAAGGQVDRSLLMHYDGTGWTPVSVSGDHLLYWVYGVGPTDVYAVGEGGTILYYDGNTWEPVVSGTEKTLFGVWGGSVDDVWIVGGDPNGDVGSAVVLRGHGTDFQRVDDLPSELLPSALYKIYGGPTNMIAVGSEGTVLRRDDGVWHKDVVPTSDPLFSLWGRASNDVYAVGGYTSGEVLHYDGTEWRQMATADAGYGLSGVFTAPDRPTIAVGAFSYVVEIDPDGTVSLPELPLMDPVPSLHGVWGDEDGTTYAVGGALYDYPSPMTGVILRRE